MGAAFARLVAEGRAAGAGGLLFLRKRPLLDEKILDY